MPKICSKSLKIAQKWAILSKIDLEFMMRGRQKIPEIPENLRKMEKYCQKLSLNLNICPKFSPNGLNLVKNKSDFMGVHREK